MNNDNEPILSHDDFMLFIQKQQQDERELFESNAKSIKEYFDTIEAGSHTKDLSDAELVKYRMQCKDIIYIVQSYLSRRTGMFTSEVELNKKAVFMYEKSLADFERLLENIEQKIKYRKEKQIVNPADRWLNDETLLRIHKEFNGRIWEEMESLMFCAVFDKANTQAVSEFKVKEKELFYLLIHRMYNYGNKYLTQKDLIKPFLEKYSLSYGNFGKTVGKETAARRRNAKVCRNINRIMPLDEAVTDY